MAAKEPSRSSRVQQSFQQLSVVSQTLNAASDKLGKSIAEARSVSEGAWARYYELGPVQHPQIGRPARILF